MSILSLPAGVWGLNVIPFLSTIDLVYLDTASMDRRIRVDLLYWCINLKLITEVVVPSRRIKPCLYWYKLKCILVLNLNVVLGAKEFVLVYIGDTCPKLQKLQFCGKPEKSYVDGLAFLGAHCPDLFSLHLHHMDLRGAGVFSAFKNITEMKCDQCDISSTTFPFDFCKGVVRWQIYGTFITSAVLRKLFVPGFCLRKVELLRLPLITAADLLDIVRKLSDVEILRFGSGMKISDEVVRCVALSCKNLVQFECSGCNVPDDALLQLIKASPKLQIVGIRMEHKVLPDLLDAITKSSVMFIACTCSEDVRNLLSDHILPARVPAPLSIIDLVPYRGSNRI